METNDFKMHFHVSPIHCGRTHVFVHARDETVFDATHRHDHVIVAIIVRSTRSCIFHIVVKCVNQKWSATARLCNAFFFVASPKIEWELKSRDEHPHSVYFHSFPSAISTANMYVKGITLRFNSIINDERRTGKDFKRQTCAFSSYFGNCTAHSFRSTKSDNSQFIMLSEHLYSPSIINEHANQSVDQSSVEMKIIILSLLIVGTETDSIHSIKFFLCSFHRLILKIVRGAKINGCLRLTHG